MKGDYNPQCIVSKSTSQTACRGCAGLMCLTSVINAGNYLLKITLRQVIVMKLVRGVGRKKQGLFLVQFLKAMFVTAKIVSMEDLFDRQQMKLKRRG